jgi:hypothetical protein
MKNLKTLIQRSGGSFTMNERNSTLRLPLSLLRSFLKDDKSTEEIAAMFSIQQNSIVFRKELRSEASKSWTDSKTLADLYHDLRNGGDVVATKRALQEFNKTDLARKFKAAIDAKRPRRRFRMSDSDGDWEYMRRFDEKPFMECYKTSSPQKILEIYAHFNFNGGVKAESINQYGAFVSAIVQLVESCGVQCRIIAVTQGNGTYYINGKSGNGTTEVEVKKTDEYLAPAVISAIFTANFFRRFLFAAIALQSDLAGGIVSWGLGSAATLKSSVQYENGRLTLSGDCMNGATEKVINEIIKAVNG